MMRATVYQTATEPLPNGAIAHRRNVETLDVDSEHAFIAEINRRYAAPGIVLEFGPIGRPWGKV